jgi:hypothetical protein
MTVKDIREHLESIIRGANALSTFLVENEEKLLPFEAKLSSIYITGFDLDSPTRDETMAFILAFPGKWEKTVSGGLMSYSIQYTPMVRLRCWATELPPSCKLIKSQRLVPEHYENVQTIECVQTLAPADAVVEPEATSKN